MAAALGGYLTHVARGRLTLMTALLATTGASWSVALYIIATAAVTFVAVFTIKERYRRDLYETSPPEKAAVSGSSGSTRDRQRADLPV